MISFQTPPKGMPSRYGPTGLPEKLNTPTSGTPDVDQRTKATTFCAELPPSIHSNPAGELSCSQRAAVPE